MTNKEFRVRVITLTGPTCAGKSSVEAELVKMGAGRAISHTTRNPRAGEVDGVHYHFITEDQFTKAEKQGDFIETISFGSARYAMSAAAMKAALAISDTVVIVAEPKGAAQIWNFCDKNGIEVVPAWIDCDVAIQARRWITRLTGDMLVGKEVIGAYAERLTAMLTVECQWREEFQYTGYTDYFDSGKHSALQIAQAVFPNDKETK